MQKTITASRSRLAKIVVLLAYCVSASHAISQSFNKRLVETEAQRLDMVRTLIRQEKVRRLARDADGKLKSTAAFCEGMLDDLLNKRAFKAIEPVAVLDHEYPIENQQSQLASQKLGPFLTKSLQRCANEEANGDERKGSVLFNGFNWFAGAPPYRVYILSKESNPFPKSNLVYWSELVKEGHVGRKGYSWVNLDICEHTNSMSGEIWRFKDEPNGPVGALTTYQWKIGVMGGLCQRVFQYLLS